MAFYIHFFFGFFFIFFSIYFSIFWLANKAAGEWGCFQLAVIFSFLLLLLAESEWKSRKKTAELGRGLNERKDEAREKWGKEKIGQVLVQGRPCVSLLTIFTKFPARTFESRIDALPVVFIRYAYTTRTSGCTLTLVVYVAATAWTHKQEVPPNSIQLFARVRIDGATCTSSFCNSLPFWFIKAKLKKKTTTAVLPMFCCLCHKLCAGSSLQHLSICCFSSPWLPRRKKFIDKYRSPFKCFPPPSVKETGSHRWNGEHSERTTPCFFAFYL